MKYIVIFTLLLFSAFTLGAELSEVQLAELKGEWLLKEPKSYEYTLRHGGVFGYTVHQITLSKGTCKARSRLVFGKQKHRWEKSTCEGYTIQELISSVQEEELRGVFKSEIKVNTEYGFVSHYSVEPKTDATDQDWYFEVLRFKTK